MKSNETMDLLILNEQLVKAVWVHEAKSENMHLRQQLVEERQLRREAENYAECLARRIDELASRI